MAVSSPECQQYIQRRVGRSSAEYRLVRTGSSLAHSHAEVVVLASTCHDSAMVSLCAQVSLLNFVAIVFSRNRCDFAGQSG